MKLILDMLEELAKDICIYCKDGIEKRYRRTPAGCEYSKNGGYGHIIEVCGVYHRFHDNGKLFPCDADIIWALYEELKLDQRKIEQVDYEEEITE